MSLSHSKDQDACAHSVPGTERSAKSTILETGASLTQDFTPTKNICAHLNAFHIYASDPSRPPVEANHYCGHLTEDVRQCLLYDRPGPGARLIGVEYMIKPHLYEELPQEERRLWHSHVFEVKSGMLVMPQPSALVPTAAWEKAETAEMEEVIKLYGKVYHLWQVDRGDKLPLGQPELMTSITAEDQVPGLEKLMDERDMRFAGQAVDWRRKREIRKDLEEMAVHEDADWTWKKNCLISRQPTPLQQSSTSTMAPERLPLEIQDYIFGHFLQSDISSRVRGPVITFAYDPERRGHRLLCPNASECNLAECRNGLQLAWPRNTANINLKILRCVSRTWTDRAIDVFCRVNRIVIDAEVFGPSGPGVAGGTPLREQIPRLFTPIELQWMPHIHPLARLIYRNARDLEIKADRCEWWAVLSSLANSTGGFMAARTLRVRFTTRSDEADHKHHCYAMAPAEQQSLDLSNWIPALDRSRFPHLRNLIFNHDFRYLKRRQIEARRHGSFAKKEIMYLMELCRLMRALTPVLPADCRVSLAFIRRRETGLRPELPPKPLVTLVPKREDFPRYSQTADPDLNITNTPSDVWRKHDDWIGIKHRRYDVQLAPGLEDWEESRFRRFGKLLYHVRDMTRRGGSAEEDTSDWTKQRQS
ncbi:hypothetical protein QBC43DRAFT_330885 [Cladorrhinum sp. PSN259]|nr:hypothetical protein QBC43DRAFT_330885 [Cladorrhinum sp. PSN259]